MEIGTEDVYGQPPLKVLPFPQDRSLCVSIRGETRFPRFVEPLVLPDSIFEQSAEIGLELTKASTNLPSFLRDERKRKEVGIPLKVYNQQISPFLDVENTLVFFGADAIIDKQGRVIVLEVNPRAQALGRYDVTTPRIIGENDPNAKIIPALQNQLDRLLAGEGIGVIISHPQNTFYNHHKLLSEQIGFPVTTLQNLKIGPTGEVMHDDIPIKVIFRQCSMRSILDSSITDPRIVSAIEKGKVTLVNGPLVPFLGDKSLLPLLPELGAKIGQHLPGMKVVRPGEEVDLNDYRDWWLKGETRGEAEMTLQLSKNYRQGWPGRAVRAILRGDYEAAESVLSDRTNLTALRLLKHAKDFKESNPGCFLLQENVTPMSVFVQDDRGDTQKLRSMLRIYFVPHPIPGYKPHVYLEMLAGPTARVSGADYNIPVKRVA